MTTAVYPPLPASEVVKEEEASAARELSWLLASLQETLSSLRTGIEECLALIKPTEPGITLALSSPRSESLKGYVTRVGARIVKGDMQIKMYGLANTRGTHSYRLTFSHSMAPPPTSELNSPLHDPPAAHTHSPSFSSHSSSTSNQPSQRFRRADTIYFTHTPGFFTLNQLSTLRHHLQKCLSLITPTTDDTALLYTKLIPSTSPEDAQRSYENLQTLLHHLASAKLALKSPSSQSTFPHSLTCPSYFTPPLPQNLTFDLTIQDACLVSELRTIEPAHNAYSPFSSLLSMPSSDSLKKQFATFLGGGGSVVGAHSHKPAIYEEIDKVFNVKGLGEVRVKDKVRVESQDPSLMAVYTKVGGLEHALSLKVECLERVRGVAGY